MNPLPPNVVTLLSAGAVANVAAFIALANIRPLKERVTHRNNLRLACALITVVSLVLLYLLEIPDIWQRSTLVLLEVLLGFSGYEVVKRFIPREQTKKMKELSDQLAAATAALASAEERHHTFVQQVRLDFEGELDKLRTQQVEELRALTSVDGTIAGMPLLANQSSASAYRDLGKTTMDFLLGQLAYLLHLPNNPPIEVCVFAYQNDDLTVMSMPGVSPLKKEIMNRKISAHDPPRGIAGLCAFRKERIDIPDLLNPEYPHLADYWVRLHEHDIKEGAIYCEPIFVEEAEHNSSRPRLLGVLSVSSRKPHSFTDARLKWLIIGTERKARTILLLLDATDQQPS